ncbi:hypothetical protein Tco_0848290 [Tanacetum coccineum]
MAIPDPLITEAIQQSSYYPKYLEMVAENTKKTPQESASVQPETKHALPKKPTTTTPVKQSKPAPSPTKKPSKHKLPHKIRKGKPTFQLVDEDVEAQQESVPQEEGDDPDLELAKKMSLEAHQEKGEGEGDDADMERAIKLSLDPAFLPQGQAPVGGVTIKEPVSETTPKLPEVVGKGKAIVTEEQVAHSLTDLSKKKRTTDQFILVRRDQTPHDSTTGPSSQPEGVSIPVSTQGQAGSDPKKAHEALAGPDPEPMQEDQTGSNSGKANVSLAGPNPEHMDDDFLPTAYPKVHENLKLITDERVIEENPENRRTSLIADEDAMDKEVAVKVKDHKRKHDSDDDEDDDDDEGPSAGSNQGRSAKRRRPGSAASGSAQPPPKDDDQSSKKTSSCGAHASKQDYLGTKLDDALLKILERHTADLIEKYSVLRCLEVLSFKHIQKKQETANRNPANYHLYHALMETLIADEDAMDKEVKDRVKDHKRKHDSDDDEDDDDDEGPSAGSNQDLEDTDNAHIPKVTAATWFKPIPEDQRPATPEPEWTIPPNDFPEPENNWANAYATTRTGKKKLNKADLEGPAFNLVKAFHKNNYIEPAALRRPPGQCNYSTTFFFNKDLEYLLTGDKERKTALSISKLKAARYLDFGLEELVPSLWVESERDYDISAAYGIIHWWFSRKQFYINKHSEPSDREEQSDPISNSHVIRVKTFEKYGYNYDESRKFFVYLTTKEYKIS